MAAKKTQFLPLYEEAKRPQPVQLHKAETMHAECAYLLNSIIQLINNSINPLDIAIIVPSSQEQIQYLKRLARQWNIPIQSQLGYAFNTHPICIFITQFFDYILNKISIESISKAPFARLKTITIKQSLKQKKALFPKVCTISEYNDIIRKILSEFDVKAIYYSMNPLNSATDHLLSGYHALMHALDEMDQFNMTLTQADYIELCKHCFENLRFQSYKEEKNNGIAFLNKKESFFCNKSHVFICDF